MTASPSRAGLVSVVIPFLDPQPQFLREAIEGVLAQTYPSWELLLVDDGSREDSAVLAQQFAKQYAGRIKYLEHEGHRNRGLSASRNLGISHAHGEYLAMLDADDLWLPQKLEEQIAILDRNPTVGMLYGPSLYWFSWTGRPEDQSLDYMPALGVLPDAVLRPPTLLTSMLRGDASVPCPCSVVVRHTTVNQVGGFHEGFTGLYEDQVFFAKISLHAPVYAAGKCWDRYRRHPQSLCATASRADEIAARRTFLHWLKSYTLQAGMQHAPIYKAVTQGLWELDHPVGARLLRSGRRARRLGGRAAAWLRGSEV